MPTPKPRAQSRPFCFSVKGQVKILRLVFGLVASLFCIADGALIYRKLLFNPSGPYQKSAVHDKLVV
uniref:Chemokine like factor n=1 Tax=Catagonus wagneri TaxID=51154 RepID=A0A8C3X3P8_9CETA